MTGRPSIIERAFQLAEMGEHGTVEQIAASLSHEGYEAALSHLSGPSLKKQLQAIIRGTGRIVKPFAPADDHPPP